MARRINVQALIDQHGVMPLAQKLGVHERTVRRWKNDGIDPSPLAVDKMKGLQRESQNGNGEQKPPRRQKIELPPKQEAQNSPPDPVRGGIVPARRVGGG